MQPWNYTVREGIHFISRPDWQQEGVELGFSTRKGGISSGVYDSLNMGLHVGDSDELIWENRRRYLAIFGAGLEEAVCCEQVHGSQISRVGLSDRGRGVRTLKTAIPGCDALITNTPGVYLLSFYADCVPIYFYDPLNRAIGIAHCGWKGTMEQIALKTLEAMEDAYQTAAAEVQIFIGPGIGPCCFAIQADLRAQVNAKFVTLHDIITEDDEGLIRWDLQDTNRQLLIESGVQAAHVGVCKLCTACHTEIFYSHRQEQGMTGRMGALLGLKY